MSEATQQLMDEHRAIEKVIGLLEKAADKMEAGQRIEPTILEHAVDFIRNFADKCHHAKEEHVLFPAMLQSGVPQHGGPIEVMLADHTQGRAYVRGIVEALPGYTAGDATATEALVENLRGYARLLRGHIQKEDSVLYPISDRVLNDDEKARLSREFERVEREVAGPGEHEKHLALIGELERLVG